MRYLIGFFQFWYHFIVGDDWTIAVLVALGLILTVGLVRAGVEAWWLMPLVVLATLGLSVWRASKA